MVDHSVYSSFDMSGGNNDAVEIVLQSTDKSLTPALQKLTIQELRALRAQWLDAHQDLIQAAVLVVDELGYESRVRGNPQIWRSGDLALAHTTQTLRRDVASDQWVTEHWLLGVLRAGQSDEDVFVARYKVLRFGWKAIGDRAVDDPHFEQHNVLVPGPWMQRVTAAVATAQNARQLREDYRLEEERRQLVMQLLIPFADLVNEVK